MDVVLLTGSHPRHLYLAKKLLESNFLKGLLIEKRPNFIPSPPKNLNKKDEKNFIHHFNGRAEAEKNQFGEINEDFFLNVPLLKTDKENLNSQKVKKWIKKMNPDIVITYGVHIIKADLLQEFPELSWNIHGGLSPWYRGCITLFWPFYFLQPNWAGMTIHYLTNKLDGGDIVHHSRPILEYGDGIHDVAAKAVISVAEDLVAIIRRISNNKVIPKVKQKSNGKLFLARDWNAQHLRLIYNTFNNDIVDKYLKGELFANEPDLVNALKKG